MELIFGLIVAAVTRCDLCNRWQERVPILFWVLQYPDPKRQRGTILQVPHLPACCFNGKTDFLVRRIPY